MRLYIVPVSIGFILACNANATIHSTFPKYEKANQVQAFKFHSRFWINLHHFIYYQASLRTQGTKVDSSKLKDTAILNTLNPSQKLVWVEAINYYKRNLINKDLLLDTGMVKIKNALEDRENEPVLRKSHIPAELEVVLNNVSNSYRTQFWVEQNQTNLLWINKVKHLVLKYGDEVTGELQKIYLTQWPKGTIHVDVTNYANWAGAYTTVLPNRITISSTDPDNQELAALEIVFHEASHTLIDSIRVKISEICKRDNKHLPRRDMWHAILFYTTGEIIRNHFVRYTPLAYRNGLWDKAWPMYKSYLEKDWLPYIKGKVSFNEALERLVSDVETPG